MKKIFSCIVAGAMLVYLGGLGAANAPDRPPQNGPECRPSEDHPCPPPTIGGNKNKKHKQPPPPPPPDNENRPHNPPPD